MGFQLVSFVEKKIVTGHVPKVTFYSGEKIKQDNKCHIFILFSFLCFALFSIFCGFFPRKLLNWEIKIYRKSTGNRNLQEKEVYELK